MLWKHHNKFWCKALAQVIFVLNAQLCEWQQKLIFVGIPLLVEYEGSFWRSLTMFLIWLLAIPMKTLMDVWNICPKSLRNKTIISINLMKAYMVFQDWPFILQLIQEIPYFESWIVNCLNDGHETLLRHMDMHFFIFCIELFRWLLM
jgi:hypothetical protein